MVMIGFADDEHEPSQFVLLQKAKEYDEQDKRLGMDKIHIKVEDESRALYGGIRLVSKEGEHLLIELEDAAASALQVNGNIERLIVYQFSVFHLARSCDDLEIVVR